MEFSIEKNTPSHKFNRHWQFCVGSGHAALALRTDYCRQLKKVHDELGIQYVRFHGILNDDMHTLTPFKQVMPIPHTERFVERTFHRCGVVYDNILACGMKPFVELGFMPEFLAKDPARSEMFYGSIFSPPADYALWAKHVAEFVKYLLRRYGENEIHTWFFEVWNEPDLNDSFWHGSKEEYFHLYEVTARAVKAIDPELKVGGPATSASRWVGEFIAYCEKNAIPVDFVTTHQYSGDPLIGVDAVNESSGEATMRDLIASKISGLSSLTDDASALDVLRYFFGDPTESKTMQNDVFRRNAAITQKKAKGLPLYYTEWNASAIFSAYSNDTRLVAAYDVKAIFDVESHVSGSSIWCFSDIFEELHQFPQEFHGGFGIQTISGIEKPVYHALKLLANVSDYRLELGQGSTDGEIGIAAFKDETRMDIVLFRQKMRNENLPPETANVRVACDNPVNAKVFRIDATHCNPLALWEKTGCAPDLTPRQADDIRRNSSLAEEALDYTYEDGYASFAIPLSVNDIVFVRLGWR
jgi:xylan 1,4-beta-xylosidase